MKSSEPLQTNLHILKTKLLIPELRAEIVHRTRLTERIEAGAHGPLTLISAPAGFGKTTLLVEWLRQTARPAVWLSLDPQENDTSRFFNYFTDAINTLYPEVSKEILDLVYSMKSFSAEDLLTLLINQVAAAEKEFTVILDDYHVIENPDIHAGVTFFIEHMPPNFHLLIASRTQPPLPAARLRSRNQVMELTAADLRFNLEETTAFLNQTMGLTLTDPDAAALEQRTEGWITGLQMAALSLRSRSDWKEFILSFSGQHPYVFEFLAEEVLHQQPPEVQDFLLRTSILDMMTGPLCETVVGPQLPEGQGQEMLDMLFRCNLFVNPLDQNHHLYRYHNLFASFLEHLLEDRHPEEVPLLHRRAAHWFEQQGILEEAFKHFLAAGDVECAADGVERSVEIMMKDGGIPLLLGWIKQLPRQLVEHRPRLCLVQAWSLMLIHMDLEGSERCLQLTAAGIAAQRSSRTADEAQSLQMLNNLEGEMLACQSMLATIRGEEKVSLELIRRALESLPPENLFLRSFVSLDMGIYNMMKGRGQEAERLLKEAVHVAQRAGNLMVAVIAWAELGDLYIAQGKLQQALSTYDYALRYVKGPNGKPLLMTGSLYVGIGEVLREQNKLDEAVENLKKGIELSQSWMSMSTLDGHISLARIRQAQGDLDGAMDEMKIARQLAESTESSQLDDFLVTNYSIRMELQRGSLQTAVSLAYQKDPLYHQTSAHDLNYSIQELRRITEARVWLALARAENAPEFLSRARNELQTLLAETETQGRHGMSIEILCLLALVYQEQHEPEQAQTTLRRALAMGELEGYARVFVDEGIPMGNLLALCLAQEPQNSPELHLPTSSYMLGLLGQIEQETGSAWREASRWAQRAVPPPVTPAAVPLPPIGNELLVEPLTPRELEVLRCVAAGASNKEIAQELCLAINTVKRHTNNIFSKLGVNSRAQAAARARELGLIP